MHLVGVCGAGLRALAEYLRDRGCRVTGSDAQPAAAVLRALQATGTTVTIGHAAGNVPADCQRLIYSAAVPENNPERLAALARGIVQQSYPQFLGELTRSRDAVCVAGTHGKSTTTALLGSILSRSERRCDLICGGELLSSGRAGWAGTSGQLVIESCEFRRHFLQLTPHALAITGVEWDHVDCFGSLSDTVDAFAGLLRRVREDGLVVYRSDCRGSRRAITAARMDRRCTGPRVVSCGIAAEADWRIVSRIARPGSSIVELSGPEEERLRLTIPLPGAHNVLNAVVAAVTSLELGTDTAQVADAVARFSGLRRRLQYLGEWRGMSLWDDYAHHPTAVKAVLSALREEYPSRRLAVVFQPHQVQRTDVFRDAFAEALSMANHCWLLPAYAARETHADYGLDASQRLLDRIAIPGGRATLVPSLDRLFDTLETEGRPGDVVVLMGAGSLERMADEFTLQLRRHHAG